MRRVDTFFYGLFMDAALLRERGFEPVNPRHAKVEGWSLRIGERAALVPDPSGCTHGMLVAMSHDELARLYAEPSVAMYRPEPVLAQLADGSKVAALCFNLPEIPERIGPNIAYATKLRDVARRLGLPDAYVRTIR